jgi:hypothetical protein
VGTTKGWPFENPVISFSSENPIIRFGKENSHAFCLLKQLFQSFRNRISLVEENRN